MSGNNIFNYMFNSKGKIFGSGEKLSNEKNVTILKKVNLICNKQNFTVL